MATADQYAEWIVKNESKKGTPEFDTVAQAYKEARAETSVSSTPELKAPEKSFARGVLDTAVGGLRDVKQFGVDLGAGAVRGAGSIGATLLRPFESSEDNAARRQSMDGALQERGAQPDSVGYGAGKLGAEIAGTAGAGGALARGLSMIPGAATKAAPVIDAIRTSGMSAGGMTGLKSLLARIPGGAVTGGVSAAMVNPEDAKTGAVIGAVAPPVIMGLGRTGKVMADAYHGVATPQKVRLAGKIADAVGMPVADVRSALSQQGPQQIVGYRQTVPQIFQNPALSQMQRSLKTAGTNALGDAERVQQQQFMQTLNRVAPVDVTLQDAAARAGGAIQSYAVPARQEASKGVSALFESVDPFGESAIHLPIDQMQAASAKFLGPGTFGTGSKAAAAIGTAKQVGTQTLPAVKAIPKSAGQTQSLEQAVRRMGGIKPNDYLKGEIKDLTNRQSGTTGLITKTGKSADHVAIAMHERGFIPDEDPATLMAMLQGGAGRKVYASDHVEEGFQRMADHAAGDLPGAEIISKAVPFRTMQNLRSSIGEAAAQAEAKGANKEAAALKQMVKAIDEKINSAATGNVGEGEFFAQDMVDAYRQALKAHADKVAKFDTGPQIGMFRKGGDGQASTLGAEIPGKFYSGRRSQADDMASFKRLIANSEQAPSLTRDLQSYATTEAANTASDAGNLTSKFGNWLASRSGANKGLFNKSQNASLQAIETARLRGADAERLGMVSGSDTAQKLQGLQSLGALDSKFVNALANRIPFVGRYTGAALDGLRNTAAASQNKILADLLANPEALNAALAKTPQANGELARALMQYSQPAYRIAPILSATGAD